MNFKPTYLNVVLSIIIALIIAIWAYTSTFVYDASQLIEPAKRQAAIFGFIISFILVYIIISIIQKKK